ncbi:MAG: peptidylprolyl isomerase, partial [Microterricola sp.]
MRKIPALLISAGLLAVSLTACAPSTGPGCESAVPSGESSTIVKVSGDAGAKPTVDFPTPLKVSNTERAVVREGEGLGTVEGQQVSIDWSVYNGTS